MSNFVREKAFDGDFGKWADLRAHSDHWTGPQYKRLGCVLPIMQRPVTKRASGIGRAKVQKTAIKDWEDGTEHGEKDEVGDREHDKSKEEELDWYFKVLKLIKIHEFVQI